MFVCLSVCLSVREHVSGTACPIFAKLLKHATSGCGSVLLWRRCDALCISGFVDDVMFVRNGPYGGTRKPLQPVMSLRRRVQVNAPTASCSLDDGGRRD